MSYKPESLNLISILILSPEEWPQNLSIKSVRSARRTVPCCEGTAAILHIGNEEDPRNNTRSAQHSELLANQPGLQQQTPNSRPFFADKWALDLSSSFSIGSICPTVPTTPPQHRTVRPTEGLGTDMDWNGDRGWLCTVLVLLQCNAAV